MNHNFIIHKPYQVLTQFSPEEGKKTLKDFFKVPGDVYPVGRLDYDSEGLLLLTNDKKINKLLLDPSNNHAREYYVQVEGSITTKAIHELENGVTISINGKQYHTQKCIVRLFETPPRIPERNPPIRERKHIPTSWIKLILTEGKNRQVRKMTACVGFPTLRLIRYRIENISIENLAPGEMKKITQPELYNLLKIKKDK